MKQLIIPFVAAFGLSLGVATGVVIMRAPKAPAVQTGVKAAELPQKGTPAITAKDTTTPMADSAAVSGGAMPTANSTTATPAKGAIVDGAAPSAGHAANEPQVVTTSKPTIPPPLPNRNTKVDLASSAPPKPAVPAPKTASDSLIGRRLAQVFGAMQAKDAARVLEQMNDTDVRAILGSLSGKQQAVILGSFPTQRAAAILQATLRTASSGGVQ